MIIKQDPVSKLWCREDGAILMPPTGYKFRQFRWTFGCRTFYGYRAIKFRGKTYFVHQVVCRAFHGLPPDDKPEVDHIDRCKENNSPGNLRYADRSLNNTNKDCIDRSVEKYKVRCCDDRASYYKAWYGAHREENRAHGTAYRAKKKAQGLSFRKGSNGKYGWFSAYSCVKLAEK